MVPLENPTINPSSCSITKFVVRDTITAEMKLVRSVASIFLSRDKFEVILDRVRCLGNLKKYKFNVGYLSCLLKTGIDMVELN